MVDQRCEELLGLKFTLPKVEAEMGDYLFFWRYTIGFLKNFEKFLKQNGERIILNSWAKWRPRKCGWRSVV